MILCLLEIIKIMQQPIKLFLDHLLWIDQIIKVLFFSLAVYFEMLNSFFIVRGILSVNGVECE